MVIGRVCALSEAGSSELVPSSCCHGVMGPSVAKSECFSEAGLPWVLVQVVHCTTALS